MSDNSEDEEQTRAVLHPAFICEVYEVQMREGRYFLHTLSHSAKRWDQPTTVDFMNWFPPTSSEAGNSCGGSGRRTSGGVGSRG